MSPLRATAAGALAGVAATSVMTAVMVPARAAGLVGRLPPQEMLSKSLARAGLDDEVDPPARRALGIGAHFAFGTAAGALFGLVRAPLRAVPPPIAGIGFGLLIWLTSYAGWIPSLRLLPSPTEDQPGRPATMIAAHVVYGTVLGAVNEALRRG